MHEVLKSFRSRRRFITSMTGMLLTGQVAAVAGPPLLSVKQVSKRGWCIGDGAYNNLLLIGDDGAILVDAPPSYGARLIPTIRSITPLPITQLIYSHEHVDHIAGAGALKPTPEIVASAATAAVLARRRDPNRPQPTRIVAKQERLRLQGIPIELISQPPSHSLDTTFIIAPDEGVLVAVDLVYPGWMPYKNLGVAIDIPGVVQAHRAMLKLPFTTLVAGHVDRPGTREDVEVSLALYQDLAGTAERMYRELSFTQFLASSAGSLSGWEKHALYEQELVRRMVADLRPRWVGRLKGVDAYLADNCWAMLETFVVQGAPRFDSTTS